MTMRRDTQREDKAERDGGRAPAQKRWLHMLIPAVLLVIFVVSLGNLLRQLWIYRQAQNEYQALDTYMEAAPAEEAAGESTAQPAEEGTQEAAETLDYPKLQIDYAALSSVNSEFVGVIYIPVLDIKYPVAQTQDNSKYLHTTFEGTYNSSGCIFLDTSASPDFSDRNTFVFGHNMKNGTMFGSLKKFLKDETLCDQNPYIYIYQKDQVLVYRIFAYYTIPVQDDVYDDFVGDDGYDDYVADAKTHSVYQPTEDDGESVDWESRPNLLTLSTCYATGHVNNFVVQAALVGKV